MTKKQNLEKIKTLMLILLFISTIVLLYFIWGKSDSDFRISQLFKKEEALEQRVETSLFIAPEKVLLRSAGGEHYFTLSRSKCLELANKKINRLSANSAMMISELSSEKYAELLNENASITLSFGYSIPYADYCRIFNVKKGSGSLDSITEISFASNYKDSVFIKDGASGKCYRLLSDTTTENVSDFYNSLDMTFYMCHSAQTMLGGSGTAFIPFAVQSDLARMNLAAEDAIYPELREELAREIFGDTFDFVRRTTDAFGNSTYMYGYGEKTLFISNEGAFEYKGESKQNQSAGFRLDLETALLFAERCGGTTDEYHNGIFEIIGIQKSGTGKNITYTFSFAQKEGEVIIDEKDPALVITVSGGVVVGYKRNAFVIERTKQESASSANPANFIATNSDAIFTKTGDVLGANERDAFDYVINHISRFSICYARSAQELVPAFRLETTNGTTVYFDLYSGDLLDK